MKSLSGRGKFSQMQTQTIIKRGTKPVNRRLARRSRIRTGNNGHVHVVSPATASEIRKDLGIKSTHIRNVLRALNAIGVKL